MGYATMVRVSTLVRTVKLNSRLETRECHEPRKGLAGRSQYCALHFAVVLGQLAWFTVPRVGEQTWSDPCGFAKDHNRFDTKIRSTYARRIC